MSYGKNGTSGVIVTGLAAKKKSDRKSVDEANNRRRQQHFARKLTTSLSLPTSKTASKMTGPTKNATPTKNGTPKKSEKSIKDESSVSSKSPTFLCFKFANIKCPVKEEVHEAHKLLLKYSREVGLKMDIPMIKKSQIRAVQQLRRTATMVNYCFNPLQSLRAWGLLLNVAQGKTFKNLEKFIQNYIGKEMVKRLSQLKVDDNNNEINNINNINNDINNNSENSEGNWRANYPGLSTHEGLLSLHVDIEEDVDGCVRLFTDLQPHLQPDTQIIEISSQYYGGKSERSAIQHLCFATDPDGLYSCHRIAEEMARSSAGAIRYIVPEKRAPNWKSSMVLASCSDCTFLWEIIGNPMFIDQMKFFDENENVSVTFGLQCKTKLRHSPTKTIYELQGVFPDFNLYIIPGNSESFDDSQFLDETDNLANWVSLTTTILIPTCVTSTPISLFKFSSSSGLSRIYSREKAELTKLSVSSENEVTNYVTLWDHFHKTNFRICTKYQKNELKLGETELTSGRSHVVTHESNLENIQTNVLEIEELKNSIFSHYEDYLETNIRIMENPEAIRFNEIDANTLVFDHPFHYVLTRHCSGFPIVLCVGRFNNTPCQNLK